MGIVYKAEDLKLHNRLCAVKLLQSQTTDPNEVKRFEAELQIISRLRSPHVVQVLDTGYFEGHRLYIVMELLEGIPLSQLTKEAGALPLPRAIQITKGILAGLSEAHDFGIVHRDLKPANIFITRSRAGDEITKVLDFGIAKDTNASAEGEQLTNASVIIGTPKYMAPEQFMKSPTDPRTDIYAVGLLLYQVIAGVPPFSTNSPLIPANLATMPDEFKVGWLHLNADPQPLSVPPALWALITSMLAKDPQQRPSSVTEVITQLNQILASMSLSTGAFAPVMTPHQGVAQGPEGHSGPHSGPHHSGPHHSGPHHSGPHHSGPHHSGAHGAPQASFQVQRDEETTGLPLIHEQLGSQPTASKSSKSPLIWGAIAAVLIGGGVGAWKLNAPPVTRAPTSTMMCSHVIKVTPKVSEITLQNLKKNTLKVKSGQIFKRPCKEAWEGRVEREGFETYTFTLQGEEGLERVGEKSAPHRTTVTLKISQALLNPEPKPELKPEPKKKTWRERMREKRLQEKRLQEQRKRRAPSKGKTKGAAKSTTGAPSKAQPSPQPSPQPSVEPKPEPKPKPKPGRGLTF
jgi:serine/threonine protein kinase